MKINIKEDNNVEETVITILCREKNRDIDRLVNNLSQFDNTICGKINNEYSDVHINDIYYIETIDNLNKK